MNSTTEKHRSAFNSKKPFNTATTSKTKTARDSVVHHPFAPVYNNDSRILILGSLPSVKSRENNFYYGHPQNRFWKMLAAIIGGQTAPQTITEKTEFLLQNKIALWDVIASCEISGSSDSSIKNAVPNDIEKILHGSKIKKIICNGNTAFSLYKKFFGKKPEEKYNIQAVRLPSTSPANAAWSLEKLIKEWKKELPRGFDFATQNL